MSTSSQAMFMEDIQNLDFSMVKLKIQDPEEGLGWSADLCDIAETEYKRFLALNRAYPEVDIVPTQIVDAFWHQHILDTIKYEKDCREIFGYFLHHYPYFGMNGKDDYQNLCNAFEETKKLYVDNFNISYDREITLVDPKPKPQPTPPIKCKPNCRKQCKPKKCKPHSVA